MASISDYTNIDTIRELSTVDPELAKLLDPNAPPAAYPDLIRGRALQLQNDQKHAELLRDGTVQESTIKIPMSDGYLSETLVFRPVEPLPVESTPLIILYYGGGFQFGNPYQPHFYAHTLCSLLKATVLCPNYRLAPEHIFPAAPNDAWDAFRWALAHADKLDASPSTAGFIIGGRSAGASLAAVVAQRAVTEAVEPRITGLWLCVPWLLDEAIVPPDELPRWISREQNVNVPFFSAPMIDIIKDRYRPDVRSPLFSPFNAPTPHVGMPPTYLQVCGLDPLRDDGLIYERTSREHGVQTRMDVYAGVPHGVNTPFPTLAASRRFQVDVVVGVGKLLEKEIDKKVVEGLSAKVGW